MENHLLSHELYQGRLYIYRNRVNELCPQALVRIHRIMANYRYCPEFALH